MSLSHRHAQAVCEGTLSDPRAVLKASSSSMRSSSRNSVSAIVLNGWSSVRGDRKFREEQSFEKSRVSRRAEVELAKGCSSVTSIYRDKCDSAMLLSTG